jgi:ribonuclease HII
MLKAYYQDKLIEAGCDEAGRGCYAGPVFAAAVILPKDFFHPMLNDSKQLTPEDRHELRYVIEKEAVCFQVMHIDHEEIDRINILKASIKAMHLSLACLKPQPRFVIIDGNYFIKYKRIPHRCIIQGDSTYSSIAAASILAKTYRDDYMTRLHDEFPAYNWASNKGYGTPEHRQAIEEIGLCNYHRKSFRITPEQWSLFENPEGVNQQ